MSTPRENKNQVHLHITAAGWRTQGGDVYTRDEWTLGLVAHSGRFGGYLTRVLPKPGHSGRMRQRFMVRGAPGSENLPVTFDTLFPEHTPVAVVIATIATHPDLCAWLLAEKQHEEALRDDATKEREQAHAALAASSLPVHGGRDGEARYLDAATAIVHAVAGPRDRSGRVHRVRQTDVACTDLTAQVAAIEAALKVMRGLIDPDANTARQAALAALTETDRTQP